MFVIFTTITKAKKRIKAANRIHSRLSLKSILGIKINLWFVVGFVIGSMVPFRKAKIIELDNKYVIMLVIWFGWIARKYAKRTNSPPM